MAAAMKASHSSWKSRLGKPEDHTHDEGVQHQICQVKSVRDQSKHLVTNQEAENTDGTIIIRGPTRAQVRQNSRAEDVTHVREASNEGITQNLVVVVIDETVLQRVDIRKDGKKEKQGNKPPAGSSLIVVPGPWSLHTWKCCPRRVSRFTRVFRGILRSPFGPWARPRKDFPPQRAQRCLRKRQKP